MELKNKKILVVGLGVLGGGVASVKWFLEQGADVTVTDLRSRATLKNSVKELEGFGKTLARPNSTMPRHSAVTFVFGRHCAEDFRGADLIVIGGGVKIIGNKFLAVAKKKKIPIVNDLTLFLENVKNPVAAITGTRGKTTTANWTAHFLKAKYPVARASGNSSDDALLKLLPRLAKDKTLPAVLELSSFQLEILDARLDNSSELSSGWHTPDIAVITNLSRDHLNRHGTMRNYALAKANIFKNQTKKQALILNYDDLWTRFFLSQKPRGRVCGLSLEKRPPTKRFLIRANKKIVFGDGKGERVVLSGRVVEKIEKLGEHNIYNFLASALTAHLLGISWKEIEKRAKTLPQISLREEVILKKKNLTVVNDSAGTSPEATIAGIRRFTEKGKIILITGGTDKNLEFHELAGEIKKDILPGNLFLLNGSATQKLVAELKKTRYFRGAKPQIFESLKEILISVRKTLNVEYYTPTTVLFSPGSASFEKFRNEFDRGEKFGKYTKQLFC